MVLPSKAIFTGQSYYSVYKEINSAEASALLVPSYKSKKYVRYAKHSNSSFGALCDG